MERKTQIRLSEKRAQQWCTRVEVEQRTAEHEKPKGTNPGAEMFRDFLCAKILFDGYLIY